MDRLSLYERRMDALPLEVGEVLVHRGQRRILHGRGDFLEARSEAVIADVARQVVQDFSLALGEGYHGSFRSGTGVAVHRRYAETNVTE